MVINDAIKICFVIPYLFSKIIFNNEIINNKSCHLRKYIIQNMVGFGKNDNCCCSIFIIRI